MLYIPSVLGLCLYPLFVLRVIFVINSLRHPKRYATFLRSVAPCLVANTMTTWGVTLALFAVIVAKTFTLVKSLESSISHQQMGQAMALLAFVSAGLLQLSLVLMLIASMVLYQKLFQWIEKRTLELRGVAFGEKKAGLLGVIVGATFGLCGMYTALSAGGEDPAQAFAISNLIWSIGIMIASEFFSKMRRL